LCVRSTSFPCMRSFPWQVYYLLECTVDKLSLTSLLSRVNGQQVFLTSLLSRVYGQQVFLDKFNLTSRVYGQQVFLDKFTFSCVQSTSFPWQVYFLVYTVNKFSLTSLLSRVYGQQVFLDKFTFSCLRSTSFLDKFSLISLPSRVYGQQVSLTSFVVCVPGMLLNIYLTSRRHFVCQNHTSISSVYTCQVCLGDRIHTNKFSLSKS
jgi:hypothetical protein